MLRGIGGEEVFLDRYRRESQATRARRRPGRQAAVGARRAPGASCPASSSCSWSGSAPGPPSRARSRAGELVAFYGYSAFLMIPLRTATEYANKLIRGPGRGRPGRAGCWRSSPTSSSPPSPRRSAAAGSDLYDARSGLRVRAGPADRDRRRPARRVRRARRPARPAARAESTTTVRSAAYRSTSLRRADVRRADRRLRHRRRPVRRPPRRPARRAPATATSSARSDTASADDILEALPDGLDTVVAERGRTLLRRPAPAAGAGPRARRPTRRSWCWSSRPRAVDAHTEARIAARLRAHRAGRTTVVTTASPLLLDAVDEVAFLRRRPASSRVGTHARPARDRRRPTAASSPASRGGRGR